MDKLKKTLQSELRKNPAVEIKHTMVWQLPVLTYSVTFKRVKRSKMDILMKMMLLTFEQTQIRRAANLSELLLVEELFIEDLLKKMQRMGLVRMENGCFKLTGKGQEQLNSGIMEEELEEESTFLSYSPLHDEFWPEQPESKPGTDEVIPLYRYVIEANYIDENRILQAVAETENTVEEDGFQIEVAGVNRFNETKNECIPCLEFHMYNKDEDTFYARVYNTWLGRWDERFEKEIEEKERLGWREDYKDTASS